MHDFLWVSCQYPIPFGLSGRNASREVKLVYHNLFSVPGSPCRLDGGALFGTTPRGAWGAKP
ncbi:hypothetical protein PMHK_03970 [Pseudomonas sp. MHK4]|jgi:hypothetical protein